MEEGKKKAEGCFSPISSSSTPVLWKSRKRSGTCLLCFSPTHLISSPPFFPNYLHNFQPTSTPQFRRISSIQVHISFLLEINISTTKNVSCSHIWVRTLSE